MPEQELTQQLTPTLEIPDEEYLKLVPKVLTRSPDEFTEFQEAYNAKIDATGETSEFSKERIRIVAQAQLWEVPSLAGPQQVKKLVGVIVGQHDFRAYYKDKDAGKVPPDCSSVDMVNGSGTPGGLCINCPLSKFSSAEGDSEAQACRHLRHIYLIRSGESWLPDIVVLPPTSIKSYNNYNDALLRDYGASIWGVITELTLERAENPQKKVYSTAKFRPICRLRKEHRLTGRMVGDCNENMLKAGRALRVIGPNEPFHQIEGGAPNVS